MAVKVDRIMLRYFVPFGFECKDEKMFDNAVDMMNAGESLSFTFSKGEETLGKVIIDSSNRVCFEAGTQSYDITSEFDFGYIKSLVDKHVEAINESFDTTE